MLRRMIISSASKAARNCYSRALLQRLPDGLLSGTSIGNSKGFSTQSDESNKRGLDLDELDREIERSIKQQAGGEQGGTGADFKRFPEERDGNKKARVAHSRGGPFNWGTFYVIVITGTICTAGLLYLAKQRREEQERMRKRMIGRANIGGDWELTNCETGEVESSKDLAGNWLLIYFGFTHCPDICPEQIEKMVKVVDRLDEEKQLGIVPILPLFLSVDPMRDTAERVKNYCLDFSPKLRGYTGDKNQVEKVTRAFRVYYSQGPKTEQALRGGEDDYIVDHTVVIYLVDPDGQFADYYGQNRDVEEIVNAIRAKQMKREVAAVRGLRSPIPSSSPK